MRTLLIVVLILSACNLLGLFWLGRRSPVRPLERRPGPYARAPQRLGSRPAGPPGAQERPGPRRPPERGEGEWFDPQRIQHVREVLMKYYPELASRLEQEEGPQRHWLRRHLMRNWHWIRELVEADREDPELAEHLVHSHRIDQQLDALADECRRAEPPGRAEVEKRMRALLEEDFELRQWIRQRRLKRLDKEIDRLRDELTQRQERRGLLIDREFERRLRPGEQKFPEW